MLSIYRVQSVTEKEPGIMVAIVDTLFLLPWPKLRRVRWIGQKFGFDDGYQWFSEDGRRRLISPFSSRLNNYACYALIDRSKSWRRTA